VAGATAPLAPVLAGATDATGATDAWAVGGCSVTPIMVLLALATFAGPDDAGLAVGAAVAGAAAGETTPGGGVNCTPTMVLCALATFAGAVAGCAVFAGAVAGCAVFAGGLAVVGGAALVAGAGIPPGGIMTPIIVRAALRTAAGCAGAAAVTVGDAASAMTGAATGADVEVAVCVAGSLSGLPQLPQNRPSMGNALPQ
jgi:hypothetical protein